jgi:hypothetical protein
MAAAAGKMTDEGRMVLPLDHDSRSSAKIAQHSSEPRPMVRTSRFARLAPRHRSVGLIAAALLLALSSACAHLTAIDEVPVPFQQRLGARPMWLTIVELKNRPGRFPPSETAVVKKWEVIEDGGRAVGLREIATSSFTGLLERSRDEDEPLSEIDLTGAIDPADFLAHRHQIDGTDMAKTPQRYAFAAIDDRRFQILVNGGAGRIVFLPAPNNYRAANMPDSDADVGIWSTPFGPEGELFSYVRKMLAKSGSGQTQPKFQGMQLLHHDLGLARTIPVRLDDRFPERYVGAAAAAVVKWNKALGRELYQLDTKRARIDPGDCLSGFMLCLTWSGSDDVPLTGASGYTELSFDPQTGLIVGAVLTVFNDVPGPLHDMPVEERTRFEQGAMSWDWVADAVLRFSDSNAVRHPLPLSYVEHVLLHEMGHANGLAHNFHAPGDTTLAEPVRTVMAYPPFPVAHNAREIGPYDLARLGVIYGKKYDEKALRFCSTLDAMAPVRDRSVVRKATECDIFTVGDPAEWYMRLARHARFGVFAPYPDMSQVSDEMRTVYRELNEARGLPPLNLLTRLGFILGDQAPENAGDRTKVRDFLCSLEHDRIAISAQLATHHGLVLTCPRGGTAAVINQPKQ